METFHTNNITLHYTQSGKGSAVVFIPGSISDYRTWQKIAFRFEQDYECYVVSRRYQYPSKYPVDGDGSVAKNTQDIAEFIRSRNVGPVVLVGHSYGGFIALNVAMEFPELVRGIVAEEPIFAPILARNPKSPIELLRLLFRDFKAGISFLRLGVKGVDPTFKALAKGDTERAENTFIDGVTGGATTVANLDELTRIQLHDNIASLAGEDPFNNTIVLSKLQHIVCSTLLISGTRSPYVFQYINKELHRMIRNSKVSVIAGTGHWVHIDDEQAFYHVVNQFMREL